MRFADMGKNTLRGGRTYSAAEVALLAAHIDQVERFQQQVAEYGKQMVWHDARLRSALARVAVAAMEAGVDHERLHLLTDQASAVSAAVLTACREHALARHDGGLRHPDSREGTEGSPPMP